MSEYGFTYHFEKAIGPVTLLLLHGTGGNELDLVPAGKELLSAAHILSPRGKVLENGMPRFFRGLSPGVFDVEDLRVRTAELATFVRSAIVKHGLDERRVFAVGYSNGANIAGALLLLEPSLLSGAILFRPMVPLIPDELPSLHHKPVFIAAGRQDPYGGENQTQKLRAILTAAGADVTVHWNSGGHELTQIDIEVAKLWLKGLETAAG